ncbi:MAG: biopolymer transport protein exbB1 [Leptospiraceae bacterium]|nr:MAG: biopolymer transport protein exbB1 [Leptospiraceae bacterium]
MDNLIQLFYKGGILMWPILFLGILSLSIFIERYIFLLYTSISKKRLWEYLNHLSSSPQKNLEELIKYFKNKVYKNEILILLKLYYENPDYRRELLIKREGEYLIKNLSKRISILSLNAQIAPLIGLLGTVLGMIEAFQNISEQTNQIAPSIIAGGIWVAMLTTAFGLIIAIPSYIFYSIIEAKINHRIDNLNYILSYIKEKEEQEKNDPI